MEKKTVVLPARLRMMSMTPCGRSDPARRRVRRAVRGRACGAAPVQCRGAVSCHASIRRCAGWPFQGRPAQAMICGVPDRDGPFRTGIRKNGDLPWRHPGMEGGNIRQVSAISFPAVAMPNATGSPLMRISPELGLRSPVIIRRVGIFQHHSGQEIHRWNRLARTGRDGEPQAGCHTGGRARSVPRQAS